jgi:two-component system, NarL family, sensor histidine kinase DesK
MGQNEPVEQCATRPESKFSKGWDWPEHWSFGPEPQTRREKIGAVIGPSVFLFFLLQPILQTFSGGHSVLFDVAVMVVIVAYSAAYMAAAGLQNRTSRRMRVQLFAAMVVCVSLLALLLGPPALLYATYVISIGLMILPRNVGAITGVVFTAALLISTRITTGVADWGNAWVLVVLTAAMFAFGALMSTIGELRATQERMATLAVAEERSRLARDLHDVLGHSLTTITLKAGLARRMMESSADPARAVREVRDMEDLARQAMSEVRATVSGYRTASLPAELVGARAALEAAQIAADLPHAVDDVAAGLQEAFAYTLREGVTNVIRHSTGATRCVVRLGPDWLEVRDDGSTSQEVASESRAAGGGHGLSGLAERVAKVGAALEARPLAEGGFLLRVSVPAEGEQVEQKERQVPGEVDVVGGAVSARAWVEPA